MKAFHIIKREYLDAVRKKSFIISTILAPVLLLAFYALPIVAVLFSPDEQVSVAVLDRTGVVAEPFVASVTDTLKDGRPKFAMSIVTPPDGDFDASKETLMAQLDGDELGILIEVNEDALGDGDVNYISKNHFDVDVIDDMEEWMSSVIISQRMAGEGLDYDRVKALTAPIGFTEQKITKSGVIEEGGVLGQFIMVFIFVMVLYMSLLSWGISVQRSVIEEKNSRIVEVLLSSVEPRDLFIGKMIGIGSIGLTQIAIWGVLGIAISASSALVMAQFASAVRIAPMDMVYFGLYFVLGYLLYSAMFMIVGAICNTEQEAQQLQSIVMMPLILPIMIMFLVFQNPNSILSVVLSLVPVFTPMLMLTRVLLTDPPVWQVILSIVLLLVSIYGVILFSARVFRVGILMYGKRPSFKEVLKWFRYA
jgi:ABC-2 type transport system permease protein